MSSPYIEGQGPKEEENNLESEDSSQNVVLVGGLVVNMVVFAL